MAPPGCTVAWHEKANGHVRRGGWEVSSFGRLGEIVELVLVSEVVHDRERSRLVVLSREESDEDVEQKEKWEKRWAV